MISKKMFRILFVMDIWDSVNFRESSHTESKNICIMFRLDPVVTQNNKWQYWCTNGFKVP